MESLRLRLLAWLLLPLLVVGATAAAGAYLFMERRLTSAYDLDLGDIARALVPYIKLRDGRMVLELSEVADAILRADSTDHIYYVVRDGAGHVVAGDPNLKSPPRLPGEDLLFWNDRLEGRPIRAAALEAAIGGMPVSIVAAETTFKRQHASEDAMLSAIAPAALLSLAAIVAVIFGVRRGLGPLERLREELQSRSHVDLSPVEEGRVVEELKPLVRELNLMLARLKEAQSMQARFIANAAHQLRTPIAAIVTQLELAGREGTEREAHFQNAREGAARLARLAQQVLSLAAADPVSNPGARSEPSDLAEIVKAQADAWVRTANARQVDLEFDLAPAPIVGDPVLVGELATNLVDNSTRYGARYVLVGSRRSGTRSILEVIDDGPGIPASERTRIFERFRRLDAQTTDGSGLGLAIVAEIAQRHEATIEVDEAPSGKGTRIRVSFP
ncbi:MAG TPA: sensor histidine kinase [Usitatibacter sp.]|jgi:two-component system sensor histidine kinase TctE|nr:sensor histidine kinase [Usitatibacter sp.]